MREDFNDLSGGTSNGQITGGKDAGDTLRRDLGEAYDGFTEVIAAASQSGGNTVLDFGSLGTVTPTGVSPSPQFPIICNTAGPQRQTQSSTEARTPRSELGCGFFISLPTCECWQMTSFCNLQV
jgi:hypothetical protein